MALINDMDNSNQDKLYMSGGIKKVLNLNSCDLRGFLIPRELLKLKDIFIIIHLN